MSVLRQLNLNYIRIFLAVYRTRSMTMAAKELHLTQSGISQQIKALESALEVTLFDRVNRRIIPTEQAETLYDYCANRIVELEAILESLSQKPKSLEGKVRIGFPPVFGYHVLIPLLSRFSRLHPGVKYELQIGLASEFLPMLLEGRLDFAFLDSFAKDPQLITTEVAREHLDLVAHRDLLDRFGKIGVDIEYFRKLPFVAYVQGEPIVRSWFQQNFQKNPHDLNIIATVIDSYAIARIADEGMAVGLLPEVLASQLAEKNPSIHIFKTPARASNIIRISHLAKRTLGSGAMKCLEDIVTWLSEDPQKGVDG